MALWHRDMVLVVAHVEDLQDYQGTMARLSLESSEYPAPPHDGTGEAWAIQEPVSLLPSVNTAPASNIPTIVP